LIKLLVQRYLFEVVQNIMMILYVIDKEIVMYECFSF
jgi:hypothetical protein